MRDAQGHELSGATAEAVGHFDGAVRAFTLIYGDATSLYDAAVKVLAGLDQRITTARDKGEPVPLFDGIGDLHDAIKQAESLEEGSRQNQ